MKTRRLLSVALAASLCATTFATRAQTAAPPPAVGASAPPADKPGPRLLSPEEKRDAAVPSDDLRPEGTVTPQITIPLGQPTATPSLTEKRALRPGKTPAATGVDDAAARCEAQADKQARTRCRETLTQGPLKR